MIKSVRRQTVDAHDYTTMLHHAIGPKQFLAHCSNRFVCPVARKLHHHFSHPSWIGDLHIVVQEQQQLTPRLSCCKVVNRGIVKRMRIPQYPHVDAGFGWGMKRQIMIEAVFYWQKALQIFERRWAVRVVVNHQHFKLRIVRVVQEAINHGLQQLHPVSGRHDD